MAPPQPNNVVELLSAVVGRSFFFWYSVLGNGVSTAAKGGRCVLFRVMGFGYQRPEDDTLPAVDSIDLIIVGLGLVLVLLVLLRR